MLWMYSSLPLLRSARAAAARPLPLRPVILLIYIDFDQGKAVQTMLTGNFDNLGNLGRVVPLQLSPRLPWAQ
jgi:hypothetical protein